MNPVAIYLALDALACCAVIIAFGVHRIARALERQSKW